MAQADTVDDTTDTGAPAGDDPQTPDASQAGAHADPAGQTGGDATGGDADTPTDDGVMVVIDGEESPPSDEDDRAAPAWVKEVRERNREMARRNRELEEENQRLKATPQSAAKPLGDKPTLTSCEYDEERYERELDAWHERKRAIDAEAGQQERAQQVQREQFQQRLAAYGQAKTVLKARDMDEAEGIFKDATSQIQQAIIVSGCENPAVVVYALGKHPAKLAELSAIKDPVQFAFAVARLESKLKVQPRKQAPLPEKRTTGSAPVSGAVDNTLERLRADAARTGDLSKVIEYRRQQRVKR